MRVVVRESEVVERRREQWVIMGLRWRGGVGVGMLKSGP